MVRKRNIILLTVLVFLLFLLTTNYLLILLSSESKVSVSKALTVEDKINYELKNLPAHYTSRPLIDNKVARIFLENIRNDKNIKVAEINLERLWAEANSWVSKAQVINLRHPDLGKLFVALKKAKIIDADVDTRGTQLKLLLTLEGHQQVVFKPQWYERDRIVEGPVYAGKDRYAAEVVGFYLSAIFKKPLTPMSVPRQVSLKDEIMPVAKKRLLDTFFERNNRTCFYGKCYFCKKEDPVCSEQNSLLNGTVIFNFEAALTSHRSPWQRTYKKNKKAIWQEDPLGSYCKTVREKLPKKRIYDLVDTAIFDFLIQNGDRHHYETIGDAVIWLDNGKGLGNPNIHHIDILAPLYQCCLLRRETWKTLLELTGGTLRELLESMPDIQNIVMSDHISAIENRLLIVFATTEYCKHKKQAEHYLL